MFLISPVESTPEYFLPGASQPFGNVLTAEKSWACWLVAVKGTQPGSRPRGPVPATVPGAPNSHIADSKVVTTNVDAAITRYPCFAPYTDARSMYGNPNSTPTHTSTSKPAR